MANQFQITITAVDKATARVKAVKQAISKYTEPVTKLQKSMKSFGREIGIPKVAGAFHKVGVVVGDVTRKVRSLVAPMAAIIGVGSIGGLTLLATAWSRLAQSVSISAEGIGLSTSTLTQWQEAARLAGVSSESLTSSMKSFGDTMEDAVYGRNVQAYSMLQHLNIQLKRTAGGAVDTTAAMNDVADAIARHKGNPQAQSFIARQFGVEAILPLLRKGRKGIEEYRRTVRAYSAEMTGPVAEAGNNFQVSLTKTRLAMDGLWNSVLGRVLPVLTPMVDKLSDWIATNRELIATKLDEWMHKLSDWVSKLDFDAIAESVKDFAKRAAEAVESVGGFKSILAGMAAIVLAPLIGGVLSLTAAIIGLGAAAAKLTVGGAAAGFGLLGKLGFAGLAAYGGLKVAEAAGLPFTDEDKGYDALKHGDWLKAATYLDPTQLAGAANRKFMGGNVLPDDRLNFAHIKTSISRGEGNYRSVNLGAKGGYKSSERNLADMTVAEVQAAQKRGDFNAVGKYQMIPSTLTGGVKALGLTGSEKFTPDLQERFFDEYLIKKAGGGKAYDYLTGKSNDAASAAAALSKEWASLGVPHQMVNDRGEPVITGESYFKDRAGNRASVTPQESMAALAADRQTMTPAMMTDAVTKGVNNANVNVTAEVHTANTGAPGTSVHDGISRSSSGPRVGRTLTLDAIS